MPISIIRIQKLVFSNNDDLSKQKISEQRRCAVRREWVMKTSKDCHLARKIFLSAVEELFYKTRHFFWLILEFSTQGEVLVIAKLLGYAVNHGWENTFCAS